MKPNRGDRIGRCDPAVVVFAVAFLVKIRFLKDQTKPIWVQQNMFFSMNEFPSDSVKWLDLFFLIQSQMNQGHFTFPNARIGGASIITDDKLLLERGPTKRFEST